MTKTYTLSELLALSDDALNPLAAELRGWRLSTVGIFWRNAVGEVICHRGRFTPATDRNQSGELLEWATEQGVNFTCYVGGRREVTADFRGNIQHMEFSLRVPGNSARTETVAFCAAMLAMQGRLSDG